MKTKKIIAVIGATGAQGNGLVRAIMDDSQSPYTVRAITRNKHTEKARELTALGADVVEADLDDLDSLNKAFKDAYGAFCVTFFWEHGSPETELKHAENMAEAARMNNLQHVVWSTLEDTRKWMPLDDDRMPTLMGHYKVPHTDAKGEANHFFSDRELPVTFLLTSFYWENFIHFGMGPQPDLDGKLAISFPMGNAKLPGIASRDIGKCVYSIFKRRDEFIGKTVGVAGEHLTGTQMAEAFSRALGVDVAYNEMTPEIYRSLGFPGAEDLGNMFQFKRDFNNDFCAARKPEIARELNSSLQSFDDWLSQNKHHFSANQVA